jgi:hypothetical protein
MPPSTSTIFMHSSRVPVNPIRQNCNLCRERNLDHWDGDTLALPDTIMWAMMWRSCFMCPMDRNSHALAPLGSYLRPTLMPVLPNRDWSWPLFDCELNHQHLNGVRRLRHPLSHRWYYRCRSVPRSGDADSAPEECGSHGPSPVWNTVKFQGNWYIRTHLSQARSNWADTWSTEDSARKLHLAPQKGKENKSPGGNLVRRWHKK